MRRLRHAALFSLFALLTLPVADWGAGCGSHASAGGHVTIPLLASADPADGLLPIPQKLYAGTREDPWPIFNSPTVSVGFDNAYQDAQVVRADVEIFGEDDAKAAGISIQGEDRFPKDSASWKIPARQHVEPLGNGLYYFRARVWDEHGNVSEWSAACWVRKLWRPLEPPGGCVLLR